MKHLVACSAEILHLDRARETRPAVARVESGDSSKRRVLGERDHEQRGPDFRRVD